MFDRCSDLGDKRRRLLERSWAGVFRNHLFDELLVGDPCRHLDERLGRPSKDLHVVIGVLPPRQLHDPSDAATVRQIKRAAETDDHRFEALVQGVVASTPFQMRMALAENQAN